MHTLILPGILICLVISFVVFAVRRLPSFSSHTRASKKRSVASPTLLTGSLSGGGSVVEATSVDDEYRFNFRNARWGMSREQVKRSEDLAQVEAEGTTYLVYRARLGHMRCRVTFTMGLNDDLTGGRYSFTTVYEDGARYVADFDTLLNLYKERFGNPASVEVDWNNRTFERKKEFHGIALMEGHVTYRVCWITPRTEVILFLGKGEEAIDFFIAYTLRSDDTTTKTEEGAVSAADVADAIHIANSLSLPPRSPGKTVDTGSEGMLAPSTDGVSMTGVTDIADSIDIPDAAELLTELID